MSNEDERVFRELPLSDLLGFSKEREWIEQQLRSETGKAIKRARLDAGVTQQTLASYLSVNRSYLSHVESGSKTVSTSQLENIHNALSEMQGGTIHGIEQGTQPTESTGTSNHAERRVRHRHERVDDPHPKRGD